MRKQCEIMSPDLHQHQIPLQTASLRFCMGVLLCRDLLRQLAGLPESLLSSRRTGASQRASEQEPEVQTQQGSAAVAGLLQGAWDANSTLQPENRRWVAHSVPCVGSIARGRNDPWAKERRQGEGFLTCLADHLGEMQTLVRCRERAQVSR